MSTPDAAGIRAIRANREADRQELRAPELHPWECPPLAPPLQDQITEERSDPPVVEGTIRRLDGNPVRGPSASRQTAIPRVMAAIEPVASDR